ncbi:MAG: hypothetical protein JRJ59_02100, partial [Deltaproteobacteria bacterium]|nr:hypothetical protein [Deltaproteobacteria bacterium]
MTRLSHFVERHGQLWFVESLGPDRSHHHLVSRVVCSCASRFQQIDIIDTPAFGRMLILDSDPQSAQSDEFIYHEALVHPALIGLSPRPDLSVLVAGAGECASIREIMRHPNLKKVVGVEIDEVLFRKVEEHLTA